MQVQLGKAVGSLSIESDSGCLFSILKNNTAEESMIFFAWKVEFSIIFCYTIP